MRSRLLVALLSFLGCVIFAAVMWINSSPSSLMHVEPRPQKFRKVSVVVLDVDQDNIKQICQNIIQSLSKHELEPEFLLSVYEPVKFDLQSAKIKGYHVEKITRRSTFTSSVLEGFKKAHFTVMAVVADTSVSISELLPQLVIPVVKKECDMALAKHTDTSHILLGILSFPLTLSLSGGENATSFSLSRAVWLKACSHVSQDASSLSLELLSRCRVSGHKTVYIAGGSSEHVHEVELLSQIFSLYWSVHPIWCTLIIVAICIGLFLGLKMYRTSTTIDRSLLVL
ncbi:uncharacterized protein LOC135332206 [Halichondria panicea]|uniref:uncharacterized protein LOC135332206 n=1 Tax=Halichondria panicea TaxID=6063 RepID=UPI00312BB20A